MPTQNPTDSVPANALIAFAYFVSKGLTPAQSAGIVGNLMQESGVNPNSAGDGGAGIAGWTPPSQLYQYAAQVNQPSNSLQTQLNFIWWELNNSEQGALADLKKQSTPSGAAVSFQNEFERCYGAGTATANKPGNTCEQFNRTANADAVYTAATGKSVSGLLGQLGSTAASGQTGTSSTDVNCQIGWTWPSALGIGGGNVCIWQAGWTRALLGGLLITAGALTGLVAMGLLIGESALSGISEVPVAGKGFKTATNVYSRIGAIGAR